MGEVAFEEPAPGGTSQVKSVVTVPKRRSPAPWEPTLRIGPESGRGRHPDPLAMKGRSSVVGVTLLAGTELLLIAINPLGVLLERRAV